MVDIYKKITKLSTQENAPCPKCGRDTTAYRLSWYALKLIIAG